ncbi:HERC2, partial [Symbiodinium microadriaticum]
DHGPVDGQLRDLRSVRASATAFAALRLDGRVVSWGDAGHGGDCSEVEDQLHEIQELPSG